MVMAVVFKGWPDPWHKTDATGFNKTGLVTKEGVVIYPRRSRIARTSIRRVMQKRHRVIDLSAQPHAEQIEKFLTANAINNTLYVKALQHLVDHTSTFWTNPIKIPILTPITLEEHDVRWKRLVGQLRRGDGIFTLDSRSFGSRVIAHLDQGTWSHSATYSGNGQIIEAVTSGVIERSIEAYNNPHYRLGVYRLPGISPEQVDRLITFSRSAVGARYNYIGALILGLRLALGIWPTTRAAHTTPNILITRGDYELIDIV